MLGQLKMVGQIAGITLLYLSMIAILIYPAIHAARVA
jgi:hypothetical protein